MAGHPNRPGSPYNGLPFDQVVDTKRANRMGAIDKLSPELRSLVHDYGYPVVKSLMDVGVTKPKQIKHVVERILDEFSPTRGSFSQQGIRSQLLDPKRADAVIATDQKGGAR